MPRNSENREKELPLQFQDDKALIEFEESMGDVRVALEAGTTRALIANADYQLAGIKEADRALMGHTSTLPSDDVGDIKIRSPETHYHVAKAGVSALKVAGIAAAAGLLPFGGALATFLAMRLPENKPIPIDPIPAPKVTEYEYEYRINQGPWVPMEKKP